MIKAVIFDMDGVIVNSEPLHKKAYYNMFKDFKLDVSERLYESFTGKSTYSICEQLCLKFNLSITPYELVNSKRKHFKYIFENDKSFKMIDGAFELIKDYYKNNLKLVLASSASMLTINKVFEKFDLDKFFVAKISGADLKQSKPNPEIFLKAAKISGHNKKDCIVIEDSTNGIIAANSAGIFCIGYKSKNSFNQNHSLADLVISNFNQICFKEISKKFK